MMLGRPPRLMVVGASRGNSETAWEMNIDTSWRQRFAWLWAAYAISTAGTFIAFDAFYLIAILVLHAGPVGVSALKAVGLAVGAILAVPIAPLHATIAVLTALWGLLAGVTGPRTATAIAGVLMLLSPFLLPRQARGRSETVASQLAADGKA